MIGFNFEPSLHMFGSDPAHQILQSHGSKQPFLQHMPQVGEVGGISVGLKCPLVHQKPDNADIVSLYVRVSRLKLYGPRWPECKAHLQPDESPLLLAYAHRFHPLAFLQDGRMWMVRIVRGFIHARLAVCIEEKFSPLGQRDDRCGFDQGEDFRSVALTGGAPD